MALAFAAVGATCAVLYKGDRNYHVHLNEKMQEIYRHDTRYDILFIGSSRMHTTIYPKIVDSITGLSCYNAGNDGANAFEFYLILKGFLVNHAPPKMLVLSIDAGSLTLDKKMEYPMQYFNYTDNQEVKQALKLHSRYNTLLLQRVPMLQALYYDDYVKSMALRGLAGQNELKYKGDIRDKGFWSLGKACLEDKKLAKKEITYKLAPEDVKYLSDIIDLCKQHKIDLVFTYAPEYNKSSKEYVKNFDEVIETVSSIAKQNGIDFYRDDELPMCNDRCYFFDFNHVNNQGAITYTTILAERLKTIFLSKNIQPLP